MRQGGVLLRAACLVCVMLASCAQFIAIQEDAPPEHIDFVREKISSLVGSGAGEDLLEAAVILSRELNRGRLPMDEAEGLMAGILEDFGQRAADSGAGEQERYRRGYQVLLAHARRLFGEESFPGVEPLVLASRGEGFLDLAEGLRVAPDEGGREALALHYLARAMDLLGRSWFLDNALGLEPALWYAELARKYHHREILTLMIDMVERNHLLDDETALSFDSYSDYLTAGWRVEVGVDASVTVWVDKGIRLQDGVGFPDRNIGTGFYVGQDGYIITNYHVIASEVDPEYEGKSELFIRPAGNPQLRIPAAVVGYDRVFDIALLKAEVDAPAVLSFSPFQLLAVGSPLYAVGSPGGLESTVTAGIVSASGRRILQLGDFVQIDVPINPGNSGGPVFDVEGHLLGVVFAGVEQFEGVNFAIPSFWIQYFFPQLFKMGAVKHPWFGLSLRETGEGLLVDYVFPESPAEESGFRVGEIITAIGDQAVSSIPDSQAVLLAEGPGQLYEITLKSATPTPLHRLIHSGERPYSPFKDILGDQLANVWLPPLFGMKVIITDGSPSLYTITEVFLGSIADESGLSVNDNFRLLNWFIEPDLGIAVLQVLIQTQTKGYLEEGLQLASYIELSSFL